MPQESERKAGLAVKLLAVPLVVLSAILGLGFAQWCRTAYYGPPTTAPQSKGPELPGNICKDWEKPDLVLLLSGQQHGYLMPCGCSDPQYGGLERRYNLLQMLKERGWDVVPVDLGDLPQMKAPVGLPNIQGPLKYETAMKAHKAMGYAAVGIGQYEAMPLNTPLDLYAINDTEPRVLAANLANRDTEYPTMVGAWVLAATKTGSPKVGVTCVVGQIVEDQIKARDPKPKFGSASNALDSVLEKMDKSKVELRVLLYQGYATKPNKAFPGQPPEAIACAKAYPQFQVMLCLDEADDPPIEPIWVKHEEGKPASLVARVGHKGTYVALVGVYKTGNAAAPFKLAYQRVKLSPEFQTPKENWANQPVLQLLDRYKQRLKDDNYLAKYGQGKHLLQVSETKPMPEYVGSEACKKCHAFAYDVWKKSAHSHAYKTLVEAPRPPKNNEYDAECIVCHTIGFGYKTGFQDAVKTPKLKNVGCESCHGPASEHVKDFENKKWHALLNPWKTQPNETDKQKEQRIFRADQMCQRCHDPENDVTWTNKGFERKWPLVKHYDADAP
jgi:hypothetical protein